MNMDAARQQMIRQQIRTSDVFDEAVLEAMEQLRREDFIPAEFSQVAFADVEIPLGHGEYTFTPMLEGRILQALLIGAEDAVLEIGTGSGYLTACLARLAGHVTSIDVHPDFADAAAEKLEALQIGNVTVRCMDMTAELPDGRYDAIVVGGSMPQVDSRLVDKLGANGRMFVVLGKAPAMQAVMVRRRNAATPNVESLFETELKRLLNLAEKPEFVF